MGCVKAADYAFAARRADGRVVTWGPFSALFEGGAEGFWSLRAAGV